MFLDDAIMQQVLILSMKIDQITSCSDFSSHHQNNCLGIKGFESDVSSIIDNFIFCVSDLKFYVLVRYLLSRILILQFRFETEN